MMKQCPEGLESWELFNRFVNRKMGEHEEAEFETHVLTCDECGKRLDFVLALRPTAPVGFESRYNDAIVRRDEKRRRNEASAHQKANAARTRARKWYWFRGLWRRIRYEMRFVRVAADELAD